MKELKRWVKKKIFSRAGQDFYLHEAEDLQWEETEKKIDEAERLPRRKTKASKKHKATR
jgi:hypothetical protein